MIKYATRLQFALYLGQGYQIVDWSEDSAGLYFRINLFRNDWPGKSLKTGKRINTGTHLAASGTREELEEFVEEYLGSRPSR